MGGNEISPCRPESVISEFIFFFNHAGAASILNRLKGGGEIRNRNRKRKRKKERKKRDDFLQLHPLHGQLDEATPLHLHPITDESSHFRFKFAFIPGGSPSANRNSFPLKLIH